MRPRLKIVENILYLPVFGEIEPDSGVFYSGILVEYLGMMFSAWKQGVNLGVAPNRRRKGG
jgi:hypothetical protein